TGSCGSCTGGKVWSGVAGGGRRRRADGRQTVMSDPMKKLDLRGVTVATVLPFRNDLTIDWDGYARLLDYCACPDGIAAVFVNGHAGEGGSLSDQERDAVIARTRSHIGQKPLLAGVIGHSTAECVRQARLAEAAGADCAVLFP